MTQSIVPTPSRTIWLNRRKNRVLPEMFLHVSICILFEVHWPMSNRFVPQKQSGRRTSSFPLCKKKENLRHWGKRVHQWKTSDSWVTQWTTLNYQGCMTYHVRQSVNYSPKKIISLWVKDSGLPSVSFSKDLWLELRRSSPHPRPSPFNYLEGPKVKIVVLPTDGDSITPLERLQT